MISFLRNLSARAEFSLVISICFGFQIVSACLAIVSRWQHGTPLQVQYGPARVLGTVILELICLAALLGIGRIRGWSFSTFGLRISWKGTAEGLALYCGTTLAAIAFALMLVVLHVPKPPRLVGATLPFAILLSVVNPVFEEIIESGYLLNTLRRFGMWPAVLTVALFVGLLHAYQGPGGALFNLFFRVMLGLTYWRWRQLWPLIVAHSLQDFVALAPSLAR
jgi:membrane protease YdiL (CAAX protease family)